MLEQAPTHRLAGAALEDDVVGNHDRGSPVHLEQRVDVLQEVELLVAGGDREVVPHRSLIRSASAERRIGEDTIETVGWRRVIDGVTQSNVRLQIVKIAATVHDFSAFES